MTQPSASANTDTKDRLIHAATAMTIVTVSPYTETKHPITGEPVNGFFVLENGRRQGYVAYPTKESAEIQAKAIASIRCGQFEVGR